jgi:hypothetical protein
MRLSPLFVLALGTLAPSVAQAAEDPESRKPTTEEIESWLDSRGMASADQGTTGGDEAPPPPPRHHGLVVESSVGALGHAGPLKHVSPTSPWFLLRVGYEPFKWLMLFGEGDVSFSNTSYASQPPPPRSYWLYGFGAGLRLTVPIGDRFGIFAQGSFGGAAISEQNVLSVYGYRKADNLNVYFGGELGFEWYQVNPHLALGLHGGVRDYTGLSRDRSSEGPLAWVGGVSIRYAF